MAFKTRSASQSLSEKSISETINSSADGSKSYAVKISASESHAEDCAKRFSKRKKTLKEIRQEQIDACNELIETARYEIEVDPYRGIFDAHGKAYWMKCRDSLEAITSGNRDLPGIENSFGITCPCTKMWIRNEVEKREAALSRSRKAKRRHKSGDGTKSPCKRNKGTNANGMSSKVVVIDVDTGALSEEGDRIMKNDEDKISKVIALDQDSETEAPLTTSTSQQILVDVDNQEVRGLPWRRRNGSFSCACDYNPFCLLSLGGVVDDYLNEIVKDQSDATNTKNMFPILVLDPEEQKDVIMAATNGMEYREKREPNSAISHNSTAISETKTNATTRTDSMICTTMVECGEAEAQESTLRNSVFLDIDRIRDHLQSYIVDEEGQKKESMTEELLSAIQKWHNCLIYPGIKRRKKKDMFTFCRPVGMRNLGATCYLNSQLQCLAANLNFLQGVFNWKEETNENSNQMSIVISKMQSLLARMISGPHSVVCTDEFASAMSLESNEMQDPNEFARLLFDRMHESFERIPTMKNLLPNIFRGIFQYSTKCNRCKRISCREENFMDLNLPIQNADDSSLKALTIENLLEDYLTPEVMDGDNKYFCTHCKDACEAERSVGFKRAPQVLNIQIARYVFDLKTFQKRKLMKKIFLPRSLHINKLCGRQVKYILCGIQNHRGTSAYSGHYVAEVMDWTTGAWFEYNDEKVTLLEHGPTSSYDAQNTSTKTLKGGSQSAYNLFYIQEQFLKSSVMKQINLNSSPLLHGVIHDVSLERKNSFKIHEEIYLQKLKTMNRLKKRKAGILKLILKSNSCLMPCVWVEGSTLRRFFSCTDPMEDLLSNSDRPILRHRRFLCKHGKGLHPRDARRGKMLTTDQFQEYQDLLRVEREDYLFDQHQQGSATETYVCDLIINCTTWLRCEECASEYKEELREKCMNYCRLVRLEANLDSNALIPSENEESFAISRSFATALRKFASSKTLKPVLATKDYTQSSGSEVPITGIDHFDESDLAAIISDPEVEVQINGNDELDPLVNSKIACEHGHCNKICNKKTIRFLSAKTWEDINTIFPSAISIPVTYLDGKPQDCVSCLEENNAIANAYDELCDWASTTSLILSSGQQCESCPGIYRLVHAKDFTALNKALALVKNYRKRGPSNLTKLKDDIKNVLYSDPSFIMVQGVKMHRLTCTKHMKPLLSIKAIQEIHFQSANPMPNVKAEYTEEVPINIMHEENYASYLKSLLRIQNILNDTTTSSCTFFDFLSHVERYHPELKVRKLQIPHANDAIQIKNLIAALIVKSDHKFSLNKQPCNDCNCINIYHQNLEQVKQNTSKPTAEIKNEDVSERKGDVCTSDKFCYEIHEYDGSMEIEEIQNTLEKEWSDKMDAIGDIQPAVRRSSRKKKSASNNTFKLQAKKKDIFAQFRLLVYEKSKNKKLSSHRLSIFSFDKSSRQGILIDLLGERNDHPMHKVLSELPVTVPDETAVIHVVLSSQKINPTQAKRGFTSDGDNDESLFDMLLQMATDGQPSAHKLKAPRNGRREERGFAGTFLQSSLNVHPTTIARKKHYTNESNLEAEIPVERTIKDDSSVVHLIE